jgi:hypothetical protein
VGDDRAPGDLASCTVYHAIKLSDGTYRRKKFTGVKVDAGQVDVSSKSTSATLTLTLTGCKALGHALDSTSDPDATEFPAPAETAYPSGPVHVQAHRLAGSRSARPAPPTTRSRSRSTTRSTASISSRPGLSVLQWCGRKSTMDVDMYLKASPNDRDQLRRQHGARLGADVQQRHEDAQDRLQREESYHQAPYSTPLNGVYMQKLSLMNRWDPTAGHDVAVSYT